MEYTIRELKKEDLNTCAKLVLEEFNKQGEGFSELTAKQRCEEAFFPELAYCAEVNGKIIGLTLTSTFHYAKGKYLWIEELVVKQGFQGKGIGRALMQKLEEVCIEKKVDIISLNTRKINLPFYKKFGFGETEYVMVEKKL